MTTLLIEKNVMVPMRDGVRLATDIIRLDGAGPQPVLMARTPYDKNTWALDNLPAFDVFRAAQAGYVILIQDSRGRFASEGEFVPMFQEREDGVDAIQWASAQPWSNGMIGMFGGSYVGTSQWLPAREHPEGLRAITPMVTFSDLYEGMQYQGGVKLLHGLDWAQIMSVETIRRRMASGEAQPMNLDSLNVKDALSHLPLTDHPYLRKLAPYYLDWLAHPVPGAFWQAGSPNAAYEQITVPALNIGGWYDVFLWGTLQNYIGMRQRGGSETARRHQRLMIGPWSHMNSTGSFPEREFGMEANLRFMDLTGTHLRWYDHWLKGIENGIEEERPVGIFVMGIDQWRTEDDWPLPDTQYRNYYLHSSGQANTLHGDGVLSLEPPDTQPPDTYRYDPRRPVPTVGGQVLMPGGNGTGPRDQREVEEREDVLIYTTSVLNRPVEVTGPVQLELFVSSSARDTDFTAKLVDIYPDSRAMILTEGILRARYHKSMTQPELLESGAIYALRLDLWATSNVFLPGHRIRLEISSSNFPRFARNTNTGGDVPNEGLDQCIPAVNRIFHSAEYPSHLILPMIERQ